MIEHLGWTEAQWDTVTWWAGQLPLDWERVFWPDGNTGELRRAAALQGCWYGAMRRDIGVSLDPTPGVADAPVRLRRQIRVTLPEAGLYRPAGEAAARMRGYGGGDG